MPQQGRENDSEIVKQCADGSWGRWVKQVSVLVILRPRVLLVIAVAFALMVAAIR